MLTVKPVTDPAFSTYGKVVEGLNVSRLLEAMAGTPCPKDATVYVPGDPALEACPEAKTISDSLYGGMPVQIGYCNGHNRVLDAVEYHRDSEINIPVNGAIFVLGRQQDIRPDGTYDVTQMEAFAAPAGCVLEFYATTLHYAPCDADGEDSFRVVVVLPKGTNTGLEGVELGATPEDRLLFARNKWLIAHPESGLDKSGAFAGLVGPRAILD